MFLWGWDAAKKQEPLEIQDEVWWAFAPPATKEIRHAMRISRYQIVSKLCCCGWSAPLINLGICRGCWTSLVLNQSFHQFCTPRIANKEILRIWFWKLFETCMSAIYIYICKKLITHICGLKKQRYLQSWFIACHPLPNALVWSSMAPYFL